MAVFRWGAGVILVVAFACGDDGGPGPGQIDAAEEIDAAGGDPDAAATIDAMVGTQGPGQFCDTLPQGGPYCTADLMCCSDHVCRLPSDCPGGPGYLPCD